jgi:ubiquitin-conjugating enzyme E2 M
MVDVTALSPPDTIKVTFPDPDDIMNFRVTIEPDEGLCVWRGQELMVGMYKGGSFVFSVQITDDYPHQPPKFRCLQRVFPLVLCLTDEIYHPNIDLQGNVCLNILREEWRPVLDLNMLLVGLQVSPHPSPPRLTTVPISGAQRERST